MASPRKRLILLVIVVVPVLLLASTFVYMHGMTRLEGEPRDFWQSLEWAAETLTTTGYGGDSHWRHPAMILFVVVLQFIGVFLVFLVIPIYLIPFLEERFETRLPRKAPKLENHLVIYRYGPAVESLLPQAEAAGLPALLIESDPAVARRFFEVGGKLIHGGVGALAEAGLPRARALIANGSDDEDAAVILAARQLGFAGEIIALVEEPFHRKPILLAGADAVYTPRHILGAALAARASAMINPRVAGIQHLGALEVREIRIEPGSPLVGSTLGQADIGARTGATVVGQWVGGELTAQPTAEMRFEANGMLVVVGSEEAAEAVAAIAGDPGALKRAGPFLIGGYGEVGQKVAELLTDAGEPVRVIDRVAAPGVDLEGNILDPRILERAEVTAAQAVVLALDTDSATLFATVIVKDLAPRVPIIARVNQADNVERIYRAGADFALSISQVSGQMLARRLLGEEAVSIDPQLKVSRIEGTSLAGRRLAELALRERLGASVVAVERGERVLVELGPDFRFEQGDSVYVAGSDEAIRRCYRELGASG